MLQEATSAPLGFLGWSGPSPHFPRTTVSSVVGVCLPLVGHLLAAEVASSWSAGQQQSLGCSPLTLEAHGHLRSYTCWWSLSLSQGCRADLGTVALPAGTLGAELPRCTMTAGGVAISILLENRGSHSSSCVCASHMAPSAVVTLLRDPGRPEREVGPRQCPQPGTVGH